MLVGKTHLADVDVRHFFNELLASFATRKSTAEHRLLYRDNFSIILDFYADNKDLGMALISSGAAKILLFSTAAYQVFNKHKVCCCSARPWIASLPIFRYTTAVDVIFTARRNARIASAILATAIPSVCHLSVCLSVCPSHAGIVSKRRHVARCSLHCRIAKCV